MMETQIVWSLSVEVMSSGVILWLTKIASLNVWLQCIYIYIGLRIGEMERGQWLTITHKSTQEDIKSY